MKYSNVKDRFRMTSRPCGEMGAMSFPGALALLGGLTKWPLPTDIVEKLEFCR